MRDVLKCFKAVDVLVVRGVLFAIDIPESAFSTFSVCLLMAAGFSAADQQ